MCKTTTDAVSLWNGPDTWRPIAEAPKDGKKVRIWLGNTEAYGSFHNGSWWSSGVEVNPTHFQPLSTGPRKGTK